MSLVSLGVSPAQEDNAAHQDLANLHRPPYGVVHEVPSQNVARTEEHQSQKHYPADKDENFFCVLHTLVYFCK